MSSKISHYSNKLKRKKADLYNLHQSYTMYTLSAFQFILKGQHGFSYVLHKLCLFTAWSTYSGLEFLHENHELRPELAADTDKVQFSGGDLHGFKQLFHQAVLTLSE